jgi:hypothetical protein
MTETQKIGIKAGDHETKIVDPHGNEVKREERPHREATKEIELDFGCALEAMRCGKAIYRNIWPEGVMVLMTEFSAPEMKPVKMMMFQDQAGDLYQWHPTPVDLFAMDWCFTNPPKEDAE